MAGKSSSLKQTRRGQEAVPALRAPLAPGPVLEAALCPAPQDGLAALLLRPVLVHVVYHQHVALPHQLPNPKSPPNAPQSLTSLTPHRPLRHREPLCPAHALVPAHAPVLVLCPLTVSVKAAFMQTVEA